MVSHLLPKKRPGKFPPNFFILSPQMPKVAPISISMSTLLLKKEIKGFYSLSSSFVISGLQFALSLPLFFNLNLSTIRRCRRRRHLPHTDRRCLATPWAPLSSYTSVASPVAAAEPPSHVVDLPPSHLHPAEATVFQRFSSPQVCLPALFKLDLVHYHNPDLGFFYVLCATMCSMCICMLLVTMIADIFFK